MADLWGGHDDADDPLDDADEPMDGATWLRLAGESGPPGPPVRSRWVVPLAPLLTGGGCAAVAGVALGSSGVVAGLAAGVVVLMFFASGAFPLHLSDRLGDAAGLGLLVLLTNYAFRVLAALLVLGALVALGWADRGAAGVSVIVCALVRVHAQVLLLRRVPVRPLTGTR